MAPVIQLCKATMESNTEKVEKMTKSLGINMKKDEMGLQGKHLMKNVF